VSIPLPPAPLADEVLALMATLPRKVAPVTLYGRSVRLQPLVMERDIEALFAASNGEPITLGQKSLGAYPAEELIWRYLLSGPFATVDEFAAYVRNQVEAANGLCLSVIDVATGKQVGMYNYMNNAPEHLKVELGSIWYSPIVQRTNANLESTYLMLRHAFELGYRRVEWKCNSLNLRSRQSALRMGFKFEGIQDSHLIIKGQNRDTAWYRMLAADWPEARTRIEQMLGTKENPLPPFSGGEGGLQAG
jgi:RimJ/RimL family protein N-acetyltransferase